MMSRLDATIPDIIKICKFVCTDRATYWHNIESAMRSVSTYPVQMTDLSDNICMFTLVYNWIL